MKNYSVEKIGGKIHTILNETISRRLTKLEYQRLVRLIALLAEDAWKYQDLKS